MWPCRLCTFNNDSGSVSCLMCDNEHKPCEVINLLDDEENASLDGVQSKRPARNSRKREVIVLDDHSQNRKKMQMLAQRPSCVLDLTSGFDISVPTARTLRQIRRQQKQDEYLARTLQRIEDENYLALQPEATYDVLKDHRQNIQDLVKAQAVGIQIDSIDENPHARVGTKLYNRFVEAWQLVQDQTVELAFHGTAETNIDAICEHGLDPAKRNRQAMGQGEYFAKQALVARGYCKGGKKMLVVALLVDKSGLTADRNQVLVIHKPEYQLPLFVITFR